MRLIEVQDIDINEVIAESYDLVVFSCGYESRCTFLPDKLLKQNSSVTLILNFSEFKDEGDRKFNEQFFQINFSKGKTITNKFDDDTKIYEYLQEFNQENKKDLRVLIDYSSMSRLWYVSILNWARYSSLSSITIDFSYSAGKYNKDFQPMVINNIQALPGYEGVTTYSRTISIFGLGFDYLSSLCVLDKLEPSIVHSFIATPIYQEYQNQAEEVNAEFIQNYSEPVIYFPLNSVSKTYRMMSELVYPYLNKYNISFIPMGPKPHVLASALLSIRFNDIINLYIKGERNVPPNVEASGQCICTRVIFNNDDK